MNQTNAWCNCVSFNGVTLSGANSMLGVWAEFLVHLLQSKWEIAPEEPVGQIRSRCTVADWYQAKAGPNEVSLGLCNWEQNHATTNAMPHTAATTLQDETPGHCRQLCSAPKCRQVKVPFMSINSQLYHVISFEAKLYVGPGWSNCQISFPPARVATSNEMTRSL